VADDQTRFTELYREYHPRVLAYAARRLRSDQAQDVAEETFLIAWRRLADLPAAPLPWLLVTARNVLHDQYRADQRDRALLTEIERLIVVAADDVDDTVLERLTVLSALARLPEPDREVLMLTVWDGLSHRDAARHVGCSAATFAVRVHRARKRLAVALDTAASPAPPAVRVEP
jgi:RNA polymerase sigma-70 factor, ECF subfamily